jgi:hypothetical protein
MMFIILFPNLPRKLIATALASSANYTPSTVTVRDSTEIE